MGKAASFPPSSPGGNDNNSTLNLRRFAFELMHVAGRRAIDGDLPRLHGLGDFPEHLDLEQAVVERRALHLNIVGQAELPLEMPGRNAPVKELALGLSVLPPSTVTTFCSAVIETSSGEKPATASVIW